MKVKYEDVVVHELVLAFQVSKEPARSQLFEKIVEYFQGGIRHESNRWQVRGFGVEDLAQQCTLAVFWAATQWKEGRGASFKTYAYRSISSMLQDLKAKSTVREKAFSEQMFSDFAVDTEEQECVSYIEEALTDEKANRFERETGLYLDLKTIPMTDRQRVVVTELMRGELKQDIAKKLGLSAMTISFEVKALQKNVALAQLLGVG